VPAWLTLKPRGHPRRCCWRKVRRQQQQSLQQPDSPANPNSMQGTQPSTPPIRGPNTVPTPRQPTVENRGIGNGQPIRSVPATPPTFIPNPPLAGYRQQPLNGRTAFCQPFKRTKGIVHVA
jgi:hypothetical protein